jgi:hypothetical protein
MTTEEFVALTPEQIEVRFAVYTVGGRQVHVERSLIDGVDTAAVQTWLALNAATAIETKDDGKTSDAGGLLLGRWTWVYRIAHNDGSVTILEATAPTPTRPTS